MDNGGRQDWRDNLAEGMTILTSWQVAVLAMAPLMSAAAPATPVGAVTSITGRCVIRGTMIGMQYQGQMQSVADPKGGGSRRLAVLIPSKEDFEKQLAFDAAKLLDDYTRYGAARLSAPSDVTVVTIEDVAPGRWVGFGYGNLNPKDDPGENVDVQMTCDLAEAER